MVDAVAYRVNKKRIILKESENILISVPPSLFTQDCVIIESPDTVLLKPPSLSLSARLSSDKSLPQTGQRFQFSQVGVSWQMRKPKKCTYPGHRKLYKSHVLIFAYFMLIKNYF